MKQPPSLQQAYATLRPVPADAPVAARKELSEAAHVVLAALNRLGKSVFARFRLPADVRDDAINTILVRIVRAGPAAERADCPQTDGATTGRLITALKNAAIDETRRRKARRDDLSLDAPAGKDADRTTHHDVIEDKAAANSESAVRIQQQQQLLDRAREFVAISEQGLVDKREARRTGTGIDLWEALAQLRQAIAGEFDVNTHARTGLSDPGDAKAFKKARNALDAKYKRARAALHDAVEADLQRVRDSWEGDDEQWEDFGKLVWFVFQQTTTLQ